MHSVFTDEELHYATTVSVRQDGSVVLSHGKSHGDGQLSLVYYAPPHIWPCIVAVIHGEHPEIVGGTNDSPAGRMLFAAFLDSLGSEE